MHAKSCKALVFFLVTLELNCSLSHKIQQGIYSSPGLDTGSPVVVFVNHLEYTDEKVISLGLFC